MLTRTTNQMSENGYSFINLEYMEMMADGDNDMKQVMLDMLITELPEELDKMVALCEAASWEELGSVSHKMKSTLAFVGNDQMTNANKDIETMAKEKSDPVGINDRIKIMVEYCPKVLKELKREEQSM